jgi:hypothetical protein
MMPPAEAHILNADFLKTRGPFGLADASSADPTDRHEDFIDFPGTSGIATRQDDLKARVIVGRKGAGKTLYLRRSRAYAYDADELYADDIQQNLPLTSEIVKVADCYPKAVLTEKWMAIWRCAILRSLATHILHNKRLGFRVSSEDAELLTKGFTQVMRQAAKSHTPLSVYSQVREIIGRQDLNAVELDKLISNRQWEELEYTLGEIIHGCPPICFYIDAVDEEFRHAPAHWLMCQRGLFYQVMRLMRDTRLGGRLHVFICIRDHVYASVFESEHATRFLDADHIRVLEWDQRSIRLFLREKVRRLDATWLRDGDPSVAGWLGVDEVLNKARTVVETIDDYMLRHTRLLPRDVVVLGNALCKAMRTPDGVRPLEGADVRRVVHEAARVFGREQLEICANQIAADLMHEGAALQEISDLYTNSNPTFTGADVYQAGIRIELEAFLQGIGHDRFDRAEFSAAREVARGLFNNNGRYTDVMAVLWQNGLLGSIPASVEPGKAVFYSAAAHHNLRVEGDAESYALHPCLIDAVGLKSEGAGSYPVTPVAHDEI